MIRRNTSGTHEGGSDTEICSMFQQLVRKHYDDTDLFGACSPNCRPGKPIVKPHINPGCDMIHHETVDFTDYDASPVVLDIRDYCLLTTTSPWQLLWVKQYDYTFGDERPGLEGHWRRVVHDEENGKYTLEMIERK